MGLILRQSSYKDSDFFPKKQKGFEGYEKQPAKSRKIQSRVRRKNPEVVLSARKTLFAKNQRGCSAWKTSEKCRKTPKRTERKTNWSPQYPCKQMKILALRENRTHS